MFLSPNSARREPIEAAYPGGPLRHNQIRVVKLPPGRWTDPIICELTYVDIEVACYKALSYVWGSPRVTRPIRLNDQIYPVTVNLQSALRHLREKYKHELVLWIDALYVL